jgi:flagellar basal body rod protein FlgC
MVWTMTTWKRLTVLRAAVRYAGAVPVRGISPDAVTEMVAVLDAQRAYDTNASVFDVGKRLAERTIDMGRVQ